MKKLNVLFVGLGSIAQKHIKDFHMFCDMKNIILNVDVFRRKNDKSKEIYEMLGINNIITDIHHVDNVYDVIFLTNPTENHIQTLKEMEPYGMNFFIEKPISSVHQITEIEKFVPSRKGLYYVACPLRYCPVIQYVKKNIETENVISVRCISSSYLPDWRPNIDYRDNYSAHKDQGGGVDIDLIHEWDYITYLFGAPQKIKSLIGRKSSLEIDSNDYAIYIAEYKDKTVELHLDYFGRKTIREIMLFTDEDTIIGDIENNEIRYLKSNKTVKLDSTYNDLQCESLYFLDLLEGKATEGNDIEQAIRTLKLTQGDL